MRAASCSKRSREFEASASSSASGGGLHGSSSDFFTARPESSCSRARCRLRAARGRGPRTASAAPGASAGATGRPAFTSSAASARPHALLLGRPAPRSAGRWRASRSPPRSRARRRPSAHRAQRGRGPARRGPAPGPADRATMSASVPRKSSGTSGASRSAAVLARAPSRAGQQQPARTASRARLRKRVALVAGPQASSENSVVAVWPARPWPPWHRRRSSSQVACRHHAGRDPCRAASVAARPSFCEGWRAEPLLEQLARGGASRSSIIARRQRPRREGRAVGARRGWAMRSRAPGRATYGFSPCEARPSPEGARPRPSAASE